MWELYIANRITVPFVLNYRFIENIVFKYFQAKTFCMTASREWNLDYTVASDYRKKRTLIVLTHEKNIFIIYFVIRRVFKQFFAHMIYRILYIVIVVKYDFQAIDIPLEMSCIMNIVFYPQLYLVRLNIFATVGTRKFIDMRFIW